jgi:ankyrin repeat protein
MGASDQGHLDVVQALLDKSADVSAKSNNGATALNLATAGGHVDVMALLVQALVQAGAKP